MLNVSHKLAKANQEKTREMMLYYGVKRNDDQVDGLREQHAMTYKSLNVEENHAIKPGEIS